MTAHALLALSPLPSAPEPCPPPVDRPAARPRESHHALVERLSAQSVKKHYDAYADIDWDNPDMAIDPEDPRWELPETDSLGTTEWYRSQPQATRARLGLHQTVTAMKMGIAFENVLQRGLLEFAFGLPNRVPEYRYAYHEVIEEGHHSLMFQEFINRTDMDPKGLGFWDRLGTRFVVRLGRVFPELFLFFVLGGEEPIDFIQKQNLRGGRSLHPLARRIMQIHVTEEARHLCFARSYLSERVPTLPWHKRLRLAVMVPFILSQMSRMMLEPSAQMVRIYKIPPHVLRQAYRRNKDHKRTVRESLQSVARLCMKLGLLRRNNVWLWKLLGLGNPLLQGA